MRRWTHYVVCLSLSRRAGQRHVGVDKAGVRVQETETQLQEPRALSLACAVPLWPENHLFILLNHLFICVLFGVFGNISFFMRFRMLSNLLADDYLPETKRRRASSLCFSLTLCPPVTKYQNMTHHSRNIKSFWCL